MAETFSQKVREVAIELGEFTVDALASKLPIRVYRGIKNVRNVVQGFEKSGEIVLLRQGLYRYQGRQEPLSKVAKMWRAMRIKECFTRRDLMMLTETSIGHVKRYVFFLKCEGYIEHVSGQGHKKALYRLADPDNAPQKHPQMPRSRNKK